MAQAEGKVQFLESSNHRRPEPHEVAEAISLVDSILTAHYIKWLNRLLLELLQHGRLPFSTKALFQGRNAIPGPLHLNLHQFIHSVSQSFTNAFR